MVLSNIEVVRLSGQRMLLQEDLNRAADLLMHDGCLLIKGATDLSSLEPILEARYSQKGFTKASEHEGSLDIGSTLNAVERNIYLNRVRLSSSSRAHTNVCLGDWRNIVLRWRQISYHLL
jgi:hypothetical protein